MATRKKEAEQPLTRDELLETFDSNRIIEEKHPNLGFKSITQIRAGQEALKLLIAHNDVSARVIGKYNLLLEQQIPNVQEKEDHDRGRRRFIKSLAALGVVISTGFGINLGWSELVKNNEAFRLALETEKTLGLTAPTSSAYGWTVRYPSREPRKVYSEAGLKSLSEGGKLSGSIGSVWDTTGIKVYDFNRPSDHINVPKLHITTRVDTAGAETVSEEWILREQTDTSDPNLDPRAIILQKNDEALSLPIMLHLAIRRIKGNQSFEVKILKLTTQT